MEGGCKIGWFILDKYNIPQSSSFNIKMESILSESSNFNIKTESILSGDYVVINQLIKLKWTKTHLNNFLTYPTKNDRDKDFWKENPHIIIQKSMVICWLRFLSFSFGINISFCIMYHILNSYKIFWIEIIMEPSFKWKCKSLIHISTSRCNHSWGNQLWTIGIYRIFCSLSIQKKSILNKLKLRKFNNSK